MFLSEWDYLLCLRVATLCIQIAHFDRSPIASVFRVVLVSQPYIGQVQLT